MEEYCVDVSKIMQKWNKHEKLSKYEKMVLLSMINEAKQIRYVISDEKEFIKTSEKLKILAKDQSLIEEKEIMEDYLKD